MSLSFRLQVTEEFFKAHNGKMTSFRVILGHSWNSEISAIIPSEFQLWPIHCSDTYWSFFHYEKIRKSNLQPEGQGCGIIMGVTSLLLLGPFYYIALYWGLKNYETHCTVWSVNDGLSGNLLETSGNLPETSAAGVRKFPEVSGSFRIIHHWRTTR